MIQAQLQRGQKVLKMFLGLIVWSLERKFPRVTHISTEQLQEKIENQR